jgi:hypothetical protein
MTNWTSTMATATATATTKTKPDSDELLASLTASFNQNHISQEAVDLDILQVIGNRLAVSIALYSHRYLSGPAQTST